MRLCNSLTEVKFRPINYHDGYRQIPLHPYATATGLGAALGYRCPLLARRWQHMQQETNVFNVNIQYCSVIQCQHPRLIDFTKGGDFAHVFSATCPQDQIILLIYNLVTPGF